MWSVHWTVRICWIRNIIDISIGDYLVIGWLIVTINNQRSVNSTHKPNILIEHDALGLHSFIERVMLSSDKRVIFLIRFFRRFVDYDDMHSHRLFLSINHSVFPGLDTVSIRIVFNWMFTVIFNMSLGDLDRRNISICMLQIKL